MRPEPVYEFSLFEPRWHGFARWELRRLENNNPGGYTCTSVTVHSGWVRRKRGSKYLVTRSYDGAPLVWTWLH